MSGTWLSETRFTISLRRLSFLALLLASFGPRSALADCVDDFDAGRVTVNTPSIVSCLKELRSELSPKAFDQVPVGTIIASALAPADFASVVGDAFPVDYAKVKWILADGSDVEGSIYQVRFHENSVPDLRGVFLRGIDPTGARDSVRTAGNLQDFSTARPKSDFTGATTPSGEVAHDKHSGTMAGQEGQSHVFEYGTVPAQAVTITGGGDTETRPINVAVFFYIKIN